MQVHPSGRYRRAVPLSTSSRGGWVHVELAADATLRAMALRQSWTQDSERRVRRDDLRMKVRLRPSGSLVVFAVDASDSMNLEHRMSIAKGSVMTLLVTAQVTGDRIALISFEGDRAEVVLQPTTSLARARRRLRHLPTGGATPLAAGLYRALEVIRTQRRRDPLVRPKLVLSSDGGANVPRRPGADIDAELDSIADMFCNEEVESMVLDTNPPFESSSRLRRIARRLGADYHPVSNLDAKGVSTLLKS